VVKNGRATLRRHLSTPAPMSRIGAKRIERRGQPLTLRRLSEGLLAVRG
jgi:hypothetical protein